MVCRSKQVNAKRCGSELLGGQLLQPKPDLWL